MIRNYMLVTLRNLRKNGTYTFINIAGLSVGIACSLLILLWVFDEITYNEFLPKAERLYQVEANVTYDGRINTWGAVPLATYEVLKAENPHIVNTAILLWSDEHLLTVGENRIRKKGNFASEEFLTMFEYPLLSGNAKQVLSDPSGIVITASVAKALFGDRDPMNQIIRVDNLYDQKVTGVLRDLPGNSSLTFDCLLPWKLKESIDPNQKKNLASWDNYSYGIYVELDDNSNKATINKVLSTLPARKAPAIKNPTQIKYEFFLYPLTQWRLYTHFENGVITGGPIEYVRMFSLIAVFVLLMACINFMNLATARSERRAREVGIRKSVGSGRRQLIGQFIGESIFITSVAFVIALLLTQTVLSFYNDLVQKQLSIPYASIAFWLAAIGLILVTGIVSGSYPAFYLSSFKPIQVLKGKVQIGKGGSTPRKILVTLQFGFSILLIIGTLVVYQQVQHVKSRDMGFDRENLITIRYTDEIAKNYAVIKQTLLNSGAVVSMTKSNNAITHIGSYGFLTWPGKPKDERVLFSDLATEFDYTKTMGIKILAGRDFSENFGSDTTSIMLNKAALDMMGLKDPIGQQVFFPSGIGRTIVGIMDNAVMASPTDNIFPMFVEFNPKWAEAVTIRLAKTDDLQGALKKVGAVFTNFSPAYPFEYEFVDVEFKKKFSDIDLIGKLANLFASLAMIITGLGLFGLASFTAEQRTKEIGIRKILGASVGSLVKLVSQDFSKLVIIAFLISAPPSWWMLKKLLTRYEYRIDMPWWVFPLTGFVALVFALLTVSGQALRAANVNPVKSLRNNE